MFNRSKRLIAVSLATIITAGCMLAGCGGNKDDDQKSKEAIADKVKRDQ